MSSFTAIHESLQCEFESSTLFLWGPDNGLALPISAILTFRSHRSSDIDDEPTPEQRAAAQALIDTEIPSLEDNAAQLPQPFVPKFSPLIRQELDRKAREAATGVKETLTGIDLTRYEAQEPLESSALSSQSRAALRGALARAYASFAYLSARQDHLTLLDRHGKTAWLLGNYELEAELRILEAELAETRRQIDILTVERRRQQDDVATELRCLDETWKKGIGKMLETEIASEELKQQLFGHLRTQGRSAAVI